MAIETNIPVPRPSDLTGPSRLGVRRARQFALQAAIIIAAGTVVVAFCLAVKDGLAARGIGFSFDFLWASAGFEISEGITLRASDGWWWPVPFSSSDTNMQALIAGLINTLKVAILCILAATVLGVALGVGRLSTNWLVRRITFWIVEFLRNTPLLIQLTFWYIAVVLKLPPVAAATNLFGGFIASQQGIFFPSVTMSQEASGAALVCLALGMALILAPIARSMRQWRLWFWGIGLALLAACFAQGFPLVLDLPVATRFRASGGTALSPEMAAIFLAITVNSSAYLAEIVRGAIEALPRGQWEAASSLGFSRGDTLRDIVLPQVFRVVLPSFGNQYIGLAKNTSLGIAIGFPDLFNVSGTVANQTGRSLEGILIVMVCYLLLSWTISGIVNLLNAHFNRPGVQK